MLLRKGKESSENEISSCNYKIFFFFFHFKFERKSHEKRFLKCAKISAVVAGVVVAVLGWVKLHSSKSCDLKEEVGGCRTGSC